MNKMCISFVIMIVSISLFDIFIIHICSLVIVLVHANSYSPVACCCCQFPKLPPAICLQMGVGFIAIAVVLTGLMLYMYIRLLQRDPGKY